MKKKEISKEKKNGNKTANKKYKHLYTIKIIILITKKNEVML